MNPSSSLDMRIPFSFGGVDYKVARGVRQTNADIRLPDGTLLKVTEWEGDEKEIFPRVKTIVQIDKPTPGARITDAQVATKGSGAPPGAMN